MKSFLILLFLTSFQLVCGQTETNINAISTAKTVFDTTKSATVKKAAILYGDYMEPDTSPFNIDSSSSSKNGKLKEVKDERINLLIEDYKENKEIVGYRIQLFSGNSRWEAVKVRSDFLKKYEEGQTPHLIYQSPNFKIRVGDFQSRLEAQKNLEIYKIDYPHAFLVKDEIEIVTPK